MLDLFAQNTGILKNYFEQNNPIPFATISIITKSTE
jgi:hypothetical protein